MNGDSTAWATVNTTTAARNPLVVRWTSSRSREATHSPRAADPRKISSRIRKMTMAGSSVRAGRAAHATGDQLSDQSCKTPQHRHRNP
jgi:hypothetical protein